MASPEMLSPHNSTKDAAPGVLKPKFRATPS
jgi:hypothetical protein